MASAKLSISHKLVSQDSTNRTAKVTVNLSMTWSNGIRNTSNPKGTLKIDGKSYTFRKSFNSNRKRSGSITLYTKTVDVKYGSNGKKTLTCSASFATGTSAKTIKASYSTTLSSIASTSAPQKTDNNIIKKLDVQTGTDNTLFATWDWSKANTEEYSIEWWYYTGDGVAFEGNRTTTTIKQSTYSMPTNATSVIFKVKPVSKTHKVKKKTVAYWTSSWYSKTFNASALPPTTPSSTPTVSIEDYNLTAELQNLDVNGNQIQYEIVRDDEALYKSVAVDIIMSSASYLVGVDAGHKYKVRARSKRDSEYSDWTDYSDNVQTEPAAPSAFTTCKATSSTSVYLEWNSVMNTDTYDIEYANKASYFDTGDGTTAITGITTTKYEKLELETGKEYFFRVRAVNSAGESKWSDASSVIIGTSPEAPTTWSYSTSAIVGETMTLYWVHNAEDGSDQTHAEIELNVDGATSTITIDTPTSSDEDDESTYTYNLDTSTYSEGSEILWRIRTSGVTSEYGDWSVQRTINVYRQPELELRLLDSEGEDINTVKSFPFYISGTATPTSQTPIGYYITIVSNGTYETVDSLGNTVMINEGDEVYSEYYDVSANLELELTPSSVNLEPEMAYTIQGTVSMNSGLSGNATIEFSVGWNETAHTPDAEVFVDNTTLTASIRPYCEVDDVTYYRVDYDATIGVYTETSEKIDEITGEPIGNLVATRYLVTYEAETDTYIETTTIVTAPDGVMLEGVLTNNDNVVYIVEGSLSYYYYEVETYTGYTNNDHMVYAGKDQNGATVYFYVVVGDNPTLVEGLTYSVYRREFDGTFTEIATNIKNNATYVTDPHPALNYAKYRVIAIDDATGAVGYNDIPAIPMGETSMVLQWKEEWGDLLVSSINEDDIPETPEWSGFMLKLPYNLGVSNSHSPDVELVEYIGRKHPVPYYGTQLGESASWTAEFDKGDEDTLYLIRQLAIWMGDVYVREPSGSGYWAQVTVSYSQKYDSLVIPVTFNITRIEGGM